MSRPDPTPRPAEEVHFPALHLSPLRLFAVVVVFLVLASYAVWNSERFQNLIQGVSQTRISAALGRPVTFRQVEFRFLPPSVKLADVRIGNDPRLGPEPFLSADEVSIGGGVSLTGQELRLGRIRAVHPKVSLVQFPDGSWNLPSGINRPARKAASSCGSAKSSSSRVSSISTGGKRRSTWRSRTSPELSRRSGRITTAGR